MLYIFYTLDKFIEISSGHFQR